MQYPHFELTFIVIRGSKDGQWSMNMQIVLCINVKSFKNNTISILSNQTFYFFYTHFSLKEKNILILISYKFIKNVIYLPYIINNLHCKLWGSPKNFKILTRKDSKTKAICVQNSEWNWLDLKIIEMDWVVISNHFFNILKLRIIILVH